MTTATSTDLTAPLADLGATHYDDLRTILAAHIEQTCTARVEPHVRCNGSGRVTLRGLPDELAIYVGQTSDEALEVPGRFTLQVRVDGYWAGVNVEYSGRIDGTVFFNLEGGDHD